MQGDIVPAGTILQHGREILKQHGIGGAYTEALLLLAHVLGMPKERLLAHPEDPVSQEQAQEFMDMAERRAGGEPVAYLLGRREFMGLEFRVGPGVLVPRPETETLVEWLLDALSHGARLVDVGTGSGAIALSLKHHRPDLDVTGVDFYENALSWARKNRDLLEVDVRLVRSDLLEALQGEMFDCVVANLPYIAEGDEVSPETAFEPPEALYAGDRGLALMKRLVPQAWEALETEGLLILEMAPWQAEEMRNLLKSKGFFQTEIIMDLAGRPRFVKGHKG